MAAASTLPSLLEKLDENFLCCEICTEHYKEPKNLLCGHTFCQECLKKWAESKKGKPLTCPNCRQPWQLPAGGIEELPTNYHINNLIDFIGEEGQETKAEPDNAVTNWCEVCASNEATRACIECAELICDQCLKGHENIKANARSHSVVHVKDYRDNYAVQPTSLTSNDCDQHPGSKWEFYCQTCSIPICMKCTIIEHRVPEHKHVYLSEAAKECRISLNIKLKMVAEKVAYYNEKLANIEQVQEDLAKKKEQVKMEINKHADKLMQQIQENREQLLLNVENVCEKKTTVLGGQLDQIERVRGQAKRSFKVTKALVGGDSDSSLVSVYKQTLEQLDSLLDTEMQVEPGVNSHLQYSPAPGFGKGKQGSIAGISTVPCESFVQNTELCIPSKMKCQLVTCDIQGKRVSQGGAEVKAEFTAENGETVEGRVTDNDNGIYDIAFHPMTPDTFTLSAFLFGQPVVAGHPVKVDTNLPLKTTSVTGSEGDRPGQFYKVPGVAVSKSGEVYVADYSNSRIQVFDISGSYRRHFTVSCAARRNVKPYGVELTREEDRLVITDANSRMVCVTDLRGKLLREFGAEELGDPAGLAVSSTGHVYVADWLGACVKVFTAEGELVRTTGTKGDGPGQFRMPRSIALNSRDQMVVSDSGNNRIQVFDPDGHFLFAFGSEGREVGEFKVPHGVAVDQYDNILVCDWANHRVEMFSSEGDYIGRVDDVSDGVNMPFAITCVPGYKLVVVEQFIRLSLLKPFGAKLRILNANY